MTVATDDLGAVTEGGSRQVLVHEYAPRGTALRVLLFRGGELLVSGPAGTGKSRACLEKVLGVALANRGAKLLVVRKTGVSLTSTTLVTWREHVAKEALDAGLCEYYGGSQSEPAQYRFGNGSSVVIGGLDKPTKIMSSEYDVIYVGEATELHINDWEALTTRLRNHVVSFQQLIADCNPDMPTHWLKQRVEEGRTSILYSSHWENPRLYDPAPAEAMPEGQADDADPASDPAGEVIHRDGAAYTPTERGREYLAKLRNLTGVRRLRLHDGVWAAAEGLVYDNWNPALHMLTPDQAGKLFKTHPAKPIPAGWPRYWVVDFGYTNPFCAQWWAQDPDGRLVLYREIYRTQRLVEDHARHMLRLSTVRDYTNRPTARAARAVDDELAETDPREALARGILRWREPVPTAVICDHDAEDRATLTKYLGLGTTAAKKEVTRGIQAVEARLKPAGDGRPRLYLMTNALVELDQGLKDVGKPTCTADEFGGYVWPDTRPGRSPDEHPVKENDHGMDDVRYLVAHRDLRKKFADRDIFLEG